MKKVNVYYLGFLVFFMVVKCYGITYHIELTAPMAFFFEQKSKLYMQHPDSSWKIEAINKQKDLAKEIVMFMNLFIIHNDRDSIDCYEICCFTKMLSDKRIKFFEDDKQTILKALKVLAVWFWRDELDITPRERKLFKTFDFSTLFVAVEEASKPQNICVVQ